MECQGDQTGFMTSVLAVEQCACGSLRSILRCRTMWSHMKKGIFVLIRASNVKSVILITFSNSLDPDQA